MDRERALAVADAAGVHVVRFLIMLATAWVAGLVGIDGWYRGLAVNVVVTVFAVVLVTRRGLWRSSGMLRRWRWAAVPALTLLAFEAVLWAVNGGLTEQPPGWLLWGLSLLFVGINEELISRGVVLSKLQSVFAPLSAVAITAALFGLQHLSAFALTSRQAGDILGNVGLSAVEGFALAAFQWRYRWLWPLILVHATADFTTILAAKPLPDAAIAVDHLNLLALGLVLVLWPRRSRADPIC